MTNTTIVAHTPGPWEINESTDDDGEGSWLSIDIDAKQPHGRYNFTVANMTENLEDDREVMRANARLIASAPELKQMNAALIVAQDTLIATLRDLWNMALVQPEFTDFCDEVVVRSRDAIDAALKAARGAEAEG